MESVHEVGEGPLAERLRGIRALQQRGAALDEDEHRALHLDLHALAAALAWVAALSRVRYRATISPTDADARLDDAMSHGAWIASYLDGLARHAKRGRSFADFIRLKLTLALRAEHRRSVLSVDDSDDPLAHLSPQLRTVRRSFRLNGKSPVR